MVVSRARATFGSFGFGTRSRLGSESRYHDVTDINVHVAQRTRSSPNSGWRRVRSVVGQTDPGGRDTDANQLYSPARSVFLLRRIGNSKLRPRHFTTLIDTRAILYNVCIYIYIYTGDEMIIRDDDRSENGAVDSRNHHRVQLFDAVILNGKQASSTQN